MKGSPRRLPWLFTLKIDLVAFLLPAVVSLVILFLWGSSEKETPEWTWMLGVLLVDVAHVHATWFRILGDPRELKRRALLYLSVVSICWLAGVALYTEESRLFWRVLAYLAVFHFIRQQYGWVALYRSRAQEGNGPDWWIDAGAIYLATIYPLIYWHTRLPREFHWFLPGDFSSGIHELVERAAFCFYCLSLLAYLTKSLWSYRKGNPNPGKDIVVLTTALCWYLGIVAFNSDFAFTITNVLIHGVPYLILIHQYESKRERSVALGVRLLGIVWILAFIEEWLWDKSVWHERAWLFGAGWSPGGWEALIVPTLALPQISHYLLDALIWKRRSNPSVAELVPDTN